MIYVKQCRKCRIVKLSRHKMRKSQKLSQSHLRTFELFKNRILVQYLCTTFKIYKLLIAKTLLSKNSRSYIYILYTNTQRARDSGALYKLERIVWLPRTVFEASQYDIYQRFILKIVIMSYALLYST